jgi:hydroxymethylpyrimidine kinase/phosphomethylpyrimidine kinase
MNNEAGKNPVVMSVAGFDPSAGAGVLADIKTISAFGCYGIAAVTSVTLQNTQMIGGAYHQKPASLRRQMSMLFDDFDVAAIKTGMLPTEDIVKEVAALVRGRSLQVVVDPVLRSTSGQELADKRATEALTKYLLPLSSVVTPNVTEAERLSGIVIRDRRSMEEAAREILKHGAGAVLITGGDWEADNCPDMLLDDQGTAIYDSERVQSRHTHGTGCSLASAIACLLARGRSLRESIPIAKRYITQAILEAPQLGHGQGPLNHFPRGFDFES